MRKKGRTYGETQEAHSTENVRTRTPDPLWLIPSRLVDPRIRTHAYSYLFQCALATVFIAAVLLVRDVVAQAAIVVAVASSAFIVFAVPNSIAATPRRVIGGHAVAVVVGGVFSAILGTIEESNHVSNVMAALAVGLSILIMVSTDTEHPPAAGTALGLMIHGWSGSSVIFILSSVLILSITRVVLRRRLIDLL